MNVGMEHWNNFDFLTPDQLHGILNPGSPPSRGDAAHMSSLTIEEQLQLLADEAAPSSPTLEDQLNELAREQYADSLLSGVFTTDPGSPNGPLYEAGSPQRMPVVTAQETDETQKNKKPLPEPPPVAPANNPNVTRLTKLLLELQQTEANIKLWESQFQQAQQVLTALKNQHEKQKAVIFEYWKPNSQPQEQGQAQAQTPLTTAILVHLRDNLDTKSMVPNDVAVVNELLKEYKLYDGEIPRWRRNAPDRDDLLDRLQRIIDKQMVVFMHEDAQDLNTALKEIKDKLHTIVSVHPHPNGKAKMTDSKPANVPRKRAAKKGAVEPSSGLKWLDL